MLEFMLKKEEKPLGQVAEDRGQSWNKLGELLQRKFVENKPQWRLLIGLGLKECKNGAMHAECEMRLKFVHVRFVNFG